MEWYSKGLPRGIAVTKTNDMVTVCQWLVGMDSPHTASPNITRCCGSMWLGHNSLVKVTSANLHGSPSVDTCNKERRGKHWNWIPYHYHANPCWIALVWLDNALNSLVGLTFSIAEMLTIHFFKANIKKEEEEIAQQKQNFSSFCHSSELLYLFF